MRSTSAFLLLLLALPAFPVTAQTLAAASPATPADAKAAGVFIDDLAARAFAVLRETGSRTAVRAKFRTMLRDNFAVEDAGNRLIRRYRSQITPAQLAAYQDVLPVYIVNLYADRLYDYANATVKIVRTVPHGSNNVVDVYSRIETPGRQPFDVIWAIQKTGPKFLISNVTVSGVNLALTQEADFSSYIAKNGFDALVTFMKTANARPAA